MNIRTDVSGTNGTPPPPKDVLCNVTMRRDIHAVKDTITYCISEHRKDGTVVG